MFTQCDVLQIKSSSVWVLCPAGDKEIPSTVPSMLASFIEGMVSQALISHKKCCGKSL